MNLLPLYQKEPFPLPNTNLWRWRHKYMLHIPTSLLQYSSPQHLLTHSKLPPVHCFPPPAARSPYSCISCAVSLLPLLSPCFLYSLSPAVLLSVTDNPGNVQSAPWILALTSTTPWNAHVTSLYRYCFQDTREKIFKMQKVSRPSHVSL